MKLHNNKIVVEALNLKVVYDLGKNLYVDAVSNVSLQIFSNEILGIAGESGCGKSTLIKTLYGFIVPPLTVKSGKVFLYTSNNVIDILSTDRSTLEKVIWWKKISYIPQNAMNILNPTMRIKDIFAEMFKTHLKLKDKNEIYNKVKEYIEDFGLPLDVLSAFPHQLSGGMRQRVVIALALIFSPSIVLADEPTSALDVSTQRVVLKYLYEWQRRNKTTLVVVSHDFGVLSTLCDRIAVMYAGKIVEIGRTEEIYTKPLHPYTSMLIESLPRLGDTKERKGLSGIPPSLIFPPPGCRLHPRCPYAIDLCRKVEPPFIEIKPQHFVSCWLQVKK